jgi:iron complex outermembrane receptor protein
MKSKLLLICLSVLVTSSIAQTGAVISGVVLGGGNKPVTGFAVLRQNNTEIARTALDNRGRYSFAGLADGKYSLVIFWKSTDLTGSGDDHRDIEIKAGKSMKVDFLYGAFGDRPDEFQFPIRATVTVSAGEHQLPHQVSKTIDIIDGQQMRDRADFSLAESLRTIPGFRVQQLGGFGRTANIKTRGLRNQDTALLIDGIRFRDPAAITGDASPFISDFTLTSVDRIEVLRGSGSSLYGTNAIGGVVDFQTPDVRQGTHGQVGGAFGGLGLRRFRGNISHGTSDGKFGVAGGVSRTVYTKGVDGNDDAHNTNVQGLVDANPWSKSNLSGRIFFSDADVRLNVNPDTLGTLPSSTSTIVDAVPGVTFAPDADDPDARQKSRFFAGQFVVNQIITPEFFINGYYQGLSTRRRNDDGPLGPGFQSVFTSIYEGGIHTGNAHFTWAPVGSTNTLTAGYEFEQESFRNNNIFGADASNVRASQRSHTLYAQDLVSLMNGNLQLAGGFRFQAFDLGTPRFSAAAPPVLTQQPSDVPTAKTFDGALSYYFQNTSTKLRAHVGNGYRVPSLYERFGSYFFLGSFFPLGNPTLKPEHSIGVDGGVEQFFLEQRGKLSATYFYTKINDEITYLPTASVKESAYYNADKHFSRGLEVSGTLRPTDKTDLFASYTFTNSDVRANSRPLFPVGPVTSVDRRAFSVPDHQFTFVATQRFARAWVNFDLLVTSNYLGQIFSNTAFDNYTYRFHGNRRGDLTAGYTFGFNNDTRTLRVYGTVENVFNDKYYENGFRTAKANARIGAAFGF